MYIVHIVKDFLKAERLHGRSDCSALGLNEKEKIFKILREWREKDRSVDRDKLIFF